MKICFLSDPEYLHTQRWAQYFAGRGHEVDIVGGRVGDQGPLREIRVHPVNGARFRGPWTIGTGLALAQLLRRLRPDVVHMHYLAPLPLPIIPMVRPLVVSVWGADILGERGLVAERRRIRLLKTLVLRRAHAILATSSFLAAATRRYAGLRAERVSVCPWGVDLRQFQPVRRDGPAARPPIVIGFVKHLETKYGAEYLLRAIPGIRARHPDIRVVLVGGGSLRAQLEHITASLALEDVVRFVGDVPHDQVPHHMAEMDIFVMPSVHESETFGVAAVEAQAMGIPVVATRIGGIPEAVLEDRSALLVPPRDAEALARAVVRLIDDPALRRSMSGEGRRFVERCYDWHRNAGRVEALHERLVSRSPAGERV